MSKSSTNAFVCRECDGEIPVTAPTREAILQNGCPRCTASASSEDFDE